MYFEHNNMESLVTTYLGLFWVESCFTTNKLAK